MELTVQVETFAILALTGILLGFIFDFYRVMRGIYRPRTLITFVGDLFYWLVATTIAGGALLYSNWGEMRLYVLIALAAGAAGYFKLLSRYMIRLIISLIRWLEKAARGVRLFLYYFVVKPLLFPVRLAWSPLFRVFSHLRKVARIFEAKNPKPPG